MLRLERAVRGATVVLTAWGCLHCSTTAHERPAGNAPAVAAPQHEPTAQRAAPAPTANANTPSSKSALLAALSRYFEAAEPNPELTRAREQYLLDNKRSHGLDFAQAVECRGLICRSLLSVKSEVDARALERIGKPANLDSVVVARRVDLGDIDITVYSTTSGQTLAQLVAPDTRTQP